MYLLIHAICMFDCILYNTCNAYTYIVSMSAGEYLARFFKFNLRKIEYKIFICGLERKDCKD